MKKITVSISKPYDIIMEEDALKDVSQFLLDKYPIPRKICVMTDSFVGSIYGDQVLESLRGAGYTAFKVVFPAGEHSKNITTYSNMLESLADEGITRSDLILALGGGVVGDIAGFVAGTYMRGIDYVYSPTSLMGITDSAIGGKTGVNLLGGKNLSGIFYPPALVIFDPKTLETLPEDARRDGLAEAVRSGVVSDGSLIHQIESGNFDYIIDRCISINKTLVEVDEFDKGLRQLLGFGHTLSHGLEKLSSYTISHGAAVAKGMVAEARACAAMGYSKTDISKELDKILTKLGFDTGIYYEPEELFEITLRDKKIKDNAINIVVPEVIGKCSLKKISLVELKAFIEAACK